MKSNSNISEIRTEPEDHFAGTTEVPAISELWG